MLTASLSEGNTAHETAEKVEPLHGIIPRSYSWLISRKDTPRMNFSIPEQKKELHFGFLQPFSKQ